MKYNRCILIILIMLNSILIHSKDHEDTEFNNRFSFSFGLLAKGKIEKAIGNNFSVGIIFKGHARQLQTGVKFDFFSRYYHMGVFEKFYFQPKYSFGKHEITMVYSNERSGISPPYKEITEIYNIINEGFGIDIGFIIPFRKNKNVYLDINSGYNYYPFPKEIPLEFDFENDHYIVKRTASVSNTWFSTKKDIGLLQWNNIITGAGSPFKFSITLGWIF